MIQHPLASQLDNVVNLRRHLSAFLQSPLAHLVWVQAETLEEALQSEGTTIAQLARDVLRDGTAGIGGSEMVAIASAALGVNIYTWEQDVASCSFRLVESLNQEALTETDRTIHALHWFHEGYGHYDLLCLSEPMPQLPPLESEAAALRQMKMAAWKAKAAEVEAELANTYSTHTHTHARA
jgi:hypothetical protein